MRTKRDTIGGGQQHKVHRLLHFTGLLRQGLEIKQEMLLLYPVFLSAALRQRRSQRDLQEFLSFGTGLVRQVRELHRAVSALGGASSDPTPPALTDPDDVIGTLVCEEELAARILTTCTEILEKEWQAASELKTWLNERILGVADESRQSAAMLNRLFQTTEPRYRDRVLERFHIAALS